MAATIEASPSATGNEAQAPLRSNTIGRINIAGTKKINCLVRLRKIEIFAFPIDWKKLLMTI